MQRSRNPLNRYSISARQNLKSNADGSVDLYIQKDSPGADKESNWLPAPAGKFILMLRLYWPDDDKPSILDGSWVIPPVLIDKFCCCALQDVVHFVRFWPSAGPLTPLSVRFEPELRKDTFEIGHGALGDQFVAGCVEMFLVA